MVYHVEDHMATNIKAPQETDWNKVAALPEFRALMKAKARFVVPATIFFIAYYFALPALVGWAPKLMETKVIGPVNLAYLFALSQFFMAWTIAILYTRAADKWDSMSRAFLTNLKAGK
jgi:uncharacterized membrane protein (DUF485 family)